MKYCPYCTKRLGFWNLVRQRLTVSEGKAIACPSCKSIISSNGDASIWTAIAGSAGCGGVLGMLLAELSLKGLLVMLITFMVVFPLLVYFSAPIRSS